MKHKTHHKKSNPLFSSFHSTIDFIKKHPGRFIAIAFTHLAFLFVLSLVMTIIQYLALDSITVIFEMGGTATGGFMSAIDQPTLFQDLQGVTLTDDFQYHLRRLIILASVMIILGFIIFALFEGFAWWLAHGKERFWPFIRRFAAKSLFFYLFFIMAGYVWLRFFISSQTVASPWIGESTLRGLLWAVDIALLYFSSFAFTLTGRPYQDFKDSFRLGTRLWSFLTVLVIAAGFVIIDLLLLIPLPLTLRVVVGIVLIMSGFAFAQILLIETKELVWQKKKEG